jgi:SPFH domain / Band 7 family
MAPSEEKMDTGMEALITLGCITAGFAGITAIGAVREIRRKKAKMILDYQRGLRFVNGQFVSVVSPGVYRTALLLENVEIVDLRPTMLLIDKITYRDVLQNAAVISIGGGLKITDPHVALMNMKDRTNDVRPAIRNTVRSVLSHGIADRSEAARKKAEADLTVAINEELKKVGVTLSSLEVVEMWSEHVERGPVIAH